MSHALLNAPQPQFSLIPPSELPAAVLNCFGMLTMDDKQLYYQVARDLYTFSGAIVDLGAFCGATATALVVGVINNERFSSRTMPTAAVYSYDLFKAFGSSELLNWYYNGGRTFKEGDDFFDVFRELTSRFSGFIVPHQGDVAQASYGGPLIELLSIDVCKSRETTDAVFRKFMPMLRPGAYILQQDFIHPWHPYLHTAIGYFADHFEVIHENPVGSTVLYRLTRPIEWTQLAGFSDTCLKRKEAWLPLMDRAFSQIRAKRSIYSLRAAKTLLVAEVEGVAAAEALAASNDKALSSLDRQWVEEVLRYARIHYG